MEQQVNVTQANDKTSLVCRADELFEQTERLRSSGRIKQALQLGREALDLYTQAGDQAGIARTSHGLATLAQTRGEYDAALGWYYKSVAIQGQLGDQAGLAASYSNIGSIHYARGDYEAALEWYERSVALKEALGDRAGLATTYNNIGAVHRARGEYAAALEWYERSVALMEELGDRAGLATTYNNIGLINEARGEYAAALEWYERSVALKEALGDRAGLATTYHNIASIHYARRNYVIALSWYEKARMLQEQLGDRYSNARTLYNVGLLYRDRGDLKQSFDALTHSLDVFAAIGLIQEVDTVKATRADVAYDLGRQYVQQGRWHDGLQLLADCLTIRQQGDDLDALANVIYQIGLTRHLMGDAEQARIRYRDALRLYEHTGNQRGVAACRAGLGRLAVQTGWLDGAIRELGRAREMYTKLGDTQRLNEIGKVLRLTRHIQARQPA